MFFDWSKKHHFNAGYPKEPSYQVDTPRNIHTKFGSIWSSSVGGEEFRKIVNDDNDNENRRQLMAIAHMVFGQVS